MRHILRVVYEKISPMMKTSGKGNYSRWPKIEPGEGIKKAVRRADCGIEEIVPIERNNQRTRLDVFLVST